MPLSEGFRAPKGIPFRLIEPRFPAGTQITVMLPQGFSFEYNYLITRGNFFFSGEGPWDIPVYPLYRETMPDSVEIKLTGALTQTLTFPVSAPATTMIKSDGGRKEDFTAAQPSNHLWSNMDAGYNEDLARLHTGGQGRNERLCPFVMPGDPPDAERGSGKPSCSA